MKMRNQCFTVLLGLIFFSCSATVQAKVSAVDSWVRATVDGQSMGGAFLTLKNDSSQEASLESVQSDVATRVELHRMQETNGMMEMVQVNKIQVPAKQSVVLSPKGMHLMLMGLKRTLRTDETIPFLLTVKQNGRIQQIRVKAVVKALSQ